MALRVKIDFENHLADLHRFGKRDSRLMSIVREEDRKSSRRQRDGIAGATIESNVTFCGVGLDLRHPAKVCHTDFLNACHHVLDVGVTAVSFESASFGRLCFVGVHDREDFFAI